MKSLSNLYVLFALMVVILFSCGKKEVIVYNTDDSFLNQIELNRVLSQANANALDFLCTRMTLLEGRTDDLQSRDVFNAFDLKLSLAELDAKIEANTVRLDALNGLMLQTSDELADLTASVQNIENNFNIALGDIDTKFTNAFDGVEAELAELADSVTEMIYPCGPNASEEVLLKTPEGLIAYFEKGNSRYLSILRNGTYRTTDGFACTFTVTNGEVVK